jgi:UDP-N-acetyl-2-amino-2-deoxyglucuronate dehydrogenase
MSTYKAAVIGLSGIGTGRPTVKQPYPTLGTEWPHSHVAAYHAYPHTEVVAVCDLNEKVVETFQATWGAALPGVESYLDYREMFAKEKPDLLSVVTSDHRHAQIVIDAAEAGVKGILCEKPIATTIEEAKRMIEACEKNGVALTVNHSRRWRPHWVRARALVGEGSKLGLVKRISGSWVGDRAMLFRNGGHLVDTVNWFAGAAPEWVVGILDNEHKDHPPRYAGDGGRNPALDPGGTGLVHYKNDVRAFINCSKGANGGGVELEVFCEKGHLRVDDVSAMIVHVPDSGSSSHDRAWIQVPSVVTSLGETPSAFAELIACIEEKRTPRYTAQEASVAPAVILGMLQSNANGHAPVHFPIQDA